VLRRKRTGLPGPRRERPGGCGANERYELAPFQPDAVLALADEVIE
jgi:hypothetical protein